MALLKRIPLAEYSPNHPWAKPQISFGRKLPPNSKAILPTPKPEPETKQETKQE